MDIKNKEALQLITKSLIVEYEEFNDQKTSPHRKQQLRTSIESKEQILHNFMNVGYSECSDS